MVGHSTFSAKKAADGQTLAITIAVVVALVVFFLPLHFILVAVGKSFLFFGLLEQDS